MLLNNKVIICPEDVQGYELAIVSYSGSGKYNKPHGNFLHPFIELPDSEEVVTCETPAPIPPHGEGWWPVISMRLIDEGVARITKVSRGGIRLVCFYQLLGDTMVCWQYTMPIDDNGVEDIK